jgi:hypothetical protein
VTSYRFYYLNGHDHIIDADWASCGGDDAALARAQSILAEAQECRAIEIWQGTRRVDIVGVTMTGSC